MRIALISILVLFLTTSASTEPLPEPSPERWRQVLQFESRTWSLAFSSDGKLLASGNRTWDVATGKERPVNTARAPGYPQSIVFSPGGELFAIGKRGGRQAPNLLWQVSTGKELPTLEGKDFIVKGVAFSPDGKFMAVYGLREGTNPRGHRAKIFDALLKKELFEVPCDSYSSWLVAFLPDNKTLAVPGPNRVLTYWDLSTGKDRGKTPVIDGNPFALALKGKAVLAGIGSGAIGLFDLETGKRVASFQLGGAEVRANFHLLSADGSFLLVAGFENESRGALGTATPIQVAKWWDLSTGKELGSFRGKFTDDWIKSMCLSPDGQILAISTDTFLGLWVREKTPAEKK